jgi:hypothetical protein
MSRLPLSYLVLAAIAAPLAMVSAQTPEAQVAGFAAPVSWSLDQVFAEQAADGTIWAANGLWKASFSAGHTTFTPFLGSQEPSRPVGFRLASASVNGRELVLGGEVTTLRTQRVEIEHGTVLEAYDLREQGIEQSFVLRELPARGELHLDLALDTGLEVAADGEGFVFRCAAGAVRYGTAMAIDARGRQLTLLTQRTTAGLQLVVPAEFVAHAAMPLIIDPMISTVTALAPSTAQLKSTDIAFDASLGQYYVTYERSFSATDHDVYVAVLGADMQFQTLVTIDYTSQFWSKPRIATLEAHDMACVVAEQSVGGVAPIGIGIRSFTGGLSPVLQPVVLRTPASLSMFDPDVGGDANPVGPTRFLISYEATSIAVNGTDLHHECLLADGTFANAGTYALGVGFNRRPHISKTCGKVGGGTEGWVIVFRRETYQQTTGRLCAVFVDRSGTLLFTGGGSFTYLTAATPNLGSDWDVSSPLDHENGRLTMCVEARQDPNTGRATMYGMVFDHNAVVAVPAMTVVSGAADYRQPAVDSDGARFALAHTTIYSATDVDVRVRTLRRVGASILTDDQVSVTTSLDAESQVAICAVPGVPNRYGMSWVHQNGGSWAVECQGYLGIAAGGFVSRATGCGNLLTSAIGTPALGETVTFSVGNPGGLCGFVAGFPASLPIGVCPGCTQGVAGTALLGTTLSITIPLSPGFVGLSLAVQSFHVSPQNGPCLGQLEIGNTYDFTVR